MARKKPVEVIKLRGRPYGDPYTDGHKAGSRGLCLRHANPYPQGVERLRESRELWDMGWDEGDEERQQTGVPAWA